MHEAASTRDTTGMVFVPGGTFAMGSADFYPEERPVHEVVVDGFWVDEHPVTNQEYGRFVEATGHRTLAERAPAAADYPDADPSLLVPGSAVFAGSRTPVPLDDAMRWWRYVPGAWWRRPEGPASDLAGRERHPVVHLAHEDAAAYARWAGKHLPTEAEWERAARGGLDRAVYPWGDEEQPGGRPLTNTWQGRFPWENLEVDGFARTSPVGSFPPNGYGLVDVVGNVWEWTADWFSSHHPEPAPSPCCAPHNPRVSSPVTGESSDRRVIKGGSHLCAPSYCHRYRPAARQAEAVDTSTSHLGFRCVVREPAAAPAS